MTVKHKSMSKNEGGGGSGKPTPCGVGAEGAHRISKESSKLCGIMSYQLKPEDIRENSKRAMIQPENGAVVKCK
jgi:hypothetical protein